MKRKSEELENVVTNSHHKDVQNAYNEALYIAAKNNDTKEVEALLQRGANVNWQDKRGVTPLYVAAQLGHIAVVEHLFQHGVDVNLSREGGVTALIIAALNSHTAVVEFLLQHGADVNRQSIKDSTALHFAVETFENDHIAVIDRLLQHGANVNLQNNKGVTPLYIAAYLGHITVIDRLLQHGAEVNLQTNKGITPLHFAVRKGHIAVVEHLLQHGAEVNLQTNKGITPLHTAVQNGSLAIVKLLLEYGANPLLKETVLFEKAFNSPHKKEVLELLLQWGTKLHHYTPDKALLTQLSQNGFFSQVVAILARNTAYGSVIDLGSDIKEVAQNQHFAIVALVLVHEPDQQKRQAYLNECEQFIPTAVHPAWLKMAEMLHPFRKTGLVEQVVKTQTSPEVKIDVYSKALAPFKDYHSIATPEAMARLYQKLKPIMSQLRAPHLKEKQEKLSIMDLPYDIRLQIGVLAAGASHHISILAGQLVGPLTTEHLAKRREELANKQPHYSCEKAHKRIWSEIIKQNSVQTNPGMAGL